MASNGSVSSLGLDDLSVGGDELRAHQSEGTEALGNDIGLHISIVCLYEASGAGERRWSARGPQFLSAMMNPPSDLIIWATI